MKKRILLVGEFSLLNTGFSVMAYEILKKLHESGKYEVAELASYIGDNDPRIYQLPWKVYPAQPADNDAEGQQEYSSDPRNQFGAWRFENTVLDFKPDVIFSWRDYWHDEFITESPYKHLYYQIWSVCVDSEPPKTEWLDRFSTVDKLSSYTQWGLNVLNKYGNYPKGKVADIDTMPGVDLDVFRPMDRSSIRKKYGLQDDAFILMKCARNQPRKLYPDLIAAFMHSMDRLYKNGKDKIANKAYLYIHASLTDVGWDLIEDIKKHNASHRVLLTYFCSQCGHVFISFINGVHCYCDKCGAFAAVTPNTGVGVSRETLAELYNIADAYIQVQIAGALEIPLLEAKACGIPTMAVEYAAPYELQKLPGSLASIKIGAYKQESVRETGQLRAFVDFEDLIKKIMKVICLDKNKLQDLKIKSRETAEKYHSFDLTVNKWMQLIDAAPEKDFNRWTKEAKLIQISQNDIPWQLPNSQFIRWCCKELLPKRHHKATYLNEKKLLHNLSMGYELVPSGGTRVFDRTSVVRYVIEEVNKHNHFELHRYNILIKQPNKKETEIEYKIY